MRFGYAVRVLPSPGSSPISGWVFHNARRLSHDSFKFERHCTYALKPPCLSAHPKAGVRQLNYDTGPDFGAHALVALDELAGLVASGSLRATVGKTFSLEDVARAFNFSSGGGEGGVSEHVGKISLAVAA